MSKSTSFSSLLPICHSSYIREQKLRFDSMSMNWVQRKIYLYNVTFGLYMLDPWERYLFNALVIVLMWFIFYNGYQNLNEICKRYVW
ncbi:hypothetical protein QVD17_16306 [Tagetes erecta]|uniref:Small subunit of serine palmitoyltransferase A n=1 Tax=Tagetes erecta TaxID=13708 RepID=A0AAD8KUS7_TARER|nr:hypothetical protein QVD17_16306 [Tagetes erecta]